MVVLRCRQYCDFRFCITLSANDRSRDDISFPILNCSNFTTILSLEAQQSLVVDRRCTQRVFVCVCVIIMIIITKMLRIININVVSIIMIIMTTMMIMTTAAIITGNDKMVWAIKKY